MSAPAGIDPSAAQGEQALRAALALPAPDPDLVQRARQELMDEWRLLYGDAPARRGPAMVFVLATVVLALAVAGTLWRLGHRATGHAPIVTAGSDVGSAAPR